MAYDENKITIIEEPEIILTIDDGINDPTILMVEDESVEILEVASQGIRGADGSGDAFYEYNQILASTSWLIDHNLNKYPSVTVVDSGGTKVEGDIKYNSLNQVLLTFSNTFSGTAYFN